MKRWQGLVTLSMVALVGCGSSTPPAPATTPGATDGGAPGAGGTFLASQNPATASDGTAPTAAPIASLAPTASAEAPRVGERIFVAELSGAYDQLVVSYEGLQLVDPTTGAAERLGGGGLRAVALSPDGRSLAWVRHDDEEHMVKIADLAINGEPEHTVPGSDGTSNIAWHPDGRLSFTNYDGELWLTGTSGVGSELVSSQYRGPDPAFTLLPVWLAEYGVYASGTPVWSPDGRYVAFAANRAQTAAGQALYLFDVEAKRTSLLEVGSDLDASAPAWSPNGDALAFVGSEGATSDIYVVGITDGVLDAAPERITSDPALEVSPVWSPDGTRIAYGLNSAGTYDIWSSAADGSDPQEVLAGEGEQLPLAWVTFGAAPPEASVSPQPATGLTGQLLLTRAGENGTELTFITPAGELLREIELDGSASGARLSPDGRQVAFLRLTEAGSEDLYVVAADGSGQRRLALGVGTGFAWSPDSTRLAFYEGGETLSVINPDGTDERRLAEAVSDTNDDWPPAWRADGAAIAISGASDETAGIFIVDTASGAATYIGTDDAGGYSPAWLPEGRLIYVERTGDQFSRTFLVEVDPSDSTPRQVVEAVGEGVGRPSVSPNGAYVAFTEDQDSHLRVLERATGRVVDVPGAIASDAFSGWSPDGTHLAYVAPVDPSDPNNLERALFVSPGTVTSRVRISDAGHDVSWSRLP